MWGYAVAALVVISVLYFLIKRDRQEGVSLQVPSPVVDKKISSSLVQNIFSQGLDRLTITQKPFQQVHATMHEHIVGLDSFLYGLYVSLLVGGGHVLVEGVPGLAKTKTIATLASALALDFKRIQFTPDMLPGDLTGVEVFDSQKKSFHFVSGPLFAQIVLADEINRTTPKVQSALLEAMQEQQITVGGKTYPLPQPFIVFATQNPLEQEGTYHLPEAQVDRFLFKIVVTYPHAKAEQEMLSLIEKESSQVGALVDAEQLLGWQEEASQVQISEDIKHYIVQLVQATRETSLLKRGASPRASLALMQSAKAVAWLQGENYVTHKDIQAIALLVLRHRVALSYEVIAQGRNVDEVLIEILQGVTLL